VNLQYLDLVLKPLRDYALEPLRELAGPDRRVYLPFVGASLLIAVLVWWPRHRRSGTSLLRYLLPRRILLHRSSLFDLRWLAVRSVVLPLSSWPFKISAVAVMLWVSMHLRDAFGMPPWESPENRAWIIGGFSVALFVADDYTRYLVHRAMHRVPALWELHKLHHSAEVLTPITLYRIHPIESVLNQTRGVLTLGLVTGLFAWAFPGKLRAWEILGVEAIGFVWTALGANLRHSHVWLTWGRTLEHLFISPAMHQVHHARAAAYVNRNFGASLALWDWIAGSLFIAHGTNPVRVGIPRSERNHTLSAWSALVDPLRAAARVLTRGLRATPSAVALAPSHGAELAVGEPRDAVTSPTRTPEGLYSPVDPVEISRR
jgi:sterol desaturase/sphingolipid hydroxylase (fatty acid hydroxylase superfamily)